jgi:hypothetical protein
LLFKGRLDVDTCGSHAMFVLCACQAARYPGMPASGPLNENSQTYTWHHPKKEKKERKKKKRKKKTSLPN